MGFYVNVYHDSVVKIFHILPKIYDEFSNLRQVLLWKIVKNDQILNECMPYFKNLHSTELPTTENFRVTKLNTSGAIEVLPLQKLVLFFFLQVSQETLLLLCRRHRSGNNGIRSRICTLMRAPSPELFQCQTLTTKLFSELQYYYYVLY